MTGLVDHMGRALVGRPQTKKDEDTAHLVQAPTSPITQGLTPRKINQILEAMRQGDLTGIADAGTEMLEKNTHLFSEMSKRRSAITSLDWSLTPPPNATKEEERDTALLEAVLKDEFVSSWFNTMLFNCTDAILKGFSAQEITWSRIYYQDGLGISQQMIVPTDVEFIPQRAFMLNRENKRELLLRSVTGEGMPLRPYSWILHRSNALSGYDSENSLARVLIWPFIFAALPTRDMMEFLEIYAMPPIIGKYSAGATDVEKKTLERAVYTIGRQARGIMPHGMAIEIEQAINGSSDNYLSVIKWAEYAISKAILGGTLTSQTDDTGARSLGEVHDDARIEIRNKDVNDLEPTINRSLIYPLWAMNAKSYSGMSRRPTFTFDTGEGENVAQFAESMPKLAGMGMRISVNWAHDKLRIPIADDDEAILKAPETANPFEGYNPYEHQYAELTHKREQTNIAALKSQRETRFDAAQNGLEDALNSITVDEYKATVDPILEPIIEAINAGGVAEAIALIPEIYADLDNQKMKELLTQAIFASEVWGMIHAD